MLSDTGPPARVSVEQPERPEGAKTTWREGLALDSGQRRVTPSVPVVTGLTHLCGFKAQRSHTMIPSSILLVIYVQVKCSKSAYSLSLNAGVVLANKAFAFLLGKE